VTAVPHRDEPTAGELLTAWLARQTEALAALEGPVRADEPDAVHRMRITSRRLRSTLQAYRPLLAADTTALVGELRELAAGLGLARDSEVLGERLTAAARELPPECGPQEAAAALGRWSAEQTARARPQALAALDGPRLPALLAGLRALVAEPPLTARAERPASRELARIARREQRRTGRRIRAARQAAPGEPTAQALHEARKAAKRARYAGEPAGAAAQSFTRRMKELQDLLGAHQDAVLARRTMHGLAGTGPAFAYGVLFEQQRAAAARARAELPAVWRRARRRPTF
jgi:CHAD domain-containing protein